MTDPAPTDRAATHPAPADDVARRIGNAWRELRRGAAMRALREDLFGEGEDALAPAQFDALEVLVQCERCRMSDLAEALRVDPSTVTRTVQPLLAQGLVERAGAEGDARAVVVAPTPAGRARHTRIAARRRETLHAILADIPVADRRTLADLLERLVDAVDAFVAAHDGTS